MQTDSSESLALTWHRHKPLDEWVAITNRELGWDIDEGLKLPAVLTVYQDYVIPESKIDAFCEILRGANWEVRPMTYPEEPGGLYLFLHTRKTKRWTKLELLALVPKYHTLCGEIGGAYDGWFHISPDEDDPEF